MHSIRSELYALAAGLFKAPRKGRDQAIYSLATDILQSDIAEAPWRAPLKAIARDLSEKRHPQHLLAAEYARLFTFPTPQSTVSPFASDWLQDRGKSAMEVESLMGCQGFAAGTDSPQAPDHIVAELEFMAHLIQTSPRGAQRIFLSHLATWTSCFALAIRQAKSLPRFELAADFLEKLVNWDLRRLASNPPQRTQTAVQTDRVLT